MSAPTMEYSRGCCVRVGKRNSRFGMSEFDPLPSFWIPGGKLSRIRTQENKALSRGVATDDSEKRCAGVATQRRDLLGSDLSRVADATLRAHPLRRTATSPSGAPRATGTPPRGASAPGAARPDTIGGQPGRQRWCPRSRFCAHGRRVHDAPASPDRPPELVEIR